MASWKRAEKEVAEFFGGCRRIRISYSESIGDIIHPIYSIEVKYGKQIPKYLQPPFPTILNVGKKRYRVVPSKYLHPNANGNVLVKLKVDTLIWARAKKPNVTFLKAALAQARRYNPTLKAVVCVKPKRYVGFIAIWRIFS